MFNSSAVPHRRLSSFVSTPVDTFTLSLSSSTGNRHHGGREPEGARDPDPAVLRVGKPRAVRLVEARRHGPALQGGRTEGEFLKMRILRSIGSPCSSRDHLSRQFQFATRCSINHNGGSYVGQMPRQGVGQLSIGFLEEGTRVYRQTDGPMTQHDITICSLQWQGASKNRLLCSVKGSKLPHLAQSDWYRDQSHRTGAEG